MIIVQGDKNQGKTTQIKKIISYLLINNKSVSGFYSEKVLNFSKVVGYDIVTIPNNETFSFLQLENNKLLQTIGPFSMDQFGLAEGVIRIKKAIIDEVDFLIIDEIGKLELNNKGWCVPFEKAINEFKGEIIISVRTDFVEQVIKKWTLKNVQIINTSEIEFKTVFN